MINKLKIEPFNQKIHAFSFIAIFLCFATYPLKMSFLNSAVTLTALLGAIQLFHLPKSVFWNLKTNPFLLIFLLIWIPIVISSIDSVDPKATIKMIFNIGRFLFIATLCFALTQDHMNRITKWTLYLIAFFCVDAVIQWLTGYNILGKSQSIVGILGGKLTQDLPFSQELTRITGVFGSKFHLGYVVGTFSPLILVCAYKLYRKKLKEKLLAISLVGLLIFTVLISGSRAGWLSLIIGIFLVIIWLIKNKIVRLKVVFLISIVMITIMAISTQLPIVQKRYEQSITQYSDGYSWFDRVTSYRTTMWKVAIKEAKAHPINGIGAGGFKKAFDQVEDSKKGYFLGAYHVHLHGLEVLTETGIIGFLGYLVVCFYLIRWIYAAKKGYEWLMMAFVALMPLNTHMSIYSSFWAPLIWIPLALGLAQMQTSSKNQKSS